MACAELASWFQPRLLLPTSSPLISRRSPAEDRRDGFLSRQTVFSDATPWLFDRHHLHQSDGGVGVCGVCLGAMLIMTIGLGPRLCYPDSLAKMDVHDKQDKPTLN